MKKYQSFVLLVATLQCGIKYLDDCADMQIAKEPVFRMDLKMALKTLLTKIESWLNGYYKKNVGNIDEVFNQVSSFTEMFENSAKIAFELENRPIIEAENFQNDFDNLIKKYNITL